VPVHVHIGEPNAPVPFCRPTDQRGLRNRGRASGFQIVEHLMKPLALDVDRVDEDSKKWLVVPPHDPLSAPHSRIPGKRGPACSTLRVPPRSYQQVLRVNDTAFLR